MRGGGGGGGVTVLIRFLFQTALFETLNIITNYKSITKAADPQRVYNKLINKHPWVTSPVKCVPSQFFLRWRLPTENIKPPSDLFLSHIPLRFLATSLSVFTNSPVDFWISPLRKIRKLCWINNKKHCKRIFGVVFPGRSWVSRFSVVVFEIGDCLSE